MFRLQNTTQQLLSLAPRRFYFQVQHPALAGRPYSGAIADFTDRAILAYECGYSEVDLKVQLEHALLAGGSGLTFAHAKVLDGRAPRSSDLWLAPIHPHARGSG